MKKLLFFLFFIKAFAFWGFTHNYVEVKDQKISKILNELSQIPKHKKIIILNSKEDFRVKFRKPHKVYDIQALNKLLLKYGYPKVLKVTQETKKAKKVRIVKADAFNDYEAKGVRLVKGLTIKEAFKHFNNAYYTQNQYLDKDFEIPESPSIVIKTPFQLKQYLDAVSPYSITLRKAIDFNKDGITDLTTWKRTITLKNAQQTNLQAIISHLQAVLLLAKKVQNPDFNKKLFMQDIKDTITQLKALKQGE